MERIIRTVTSGPEATLKILSGAKKCEKVVGDTMGYRGNYNLFENSSGMPFLTKDGADSIEELFLEDPVESLTCEIIKEAARKTRDMAGDGTSQTTILVNAFLENSFEALESGKSPIDIKNSIDISVQKILNYLEKISIPITDKLIYDIAKTSANGDEIIADLVQKAYLSAGEDGSVTHVRSNSDETFVDEIDGTLVESGFSDEGFINVPSNQSVIFDNDPLVLCSLMSFQTAGQLLPFLEFALATRRDLVIISDMEHTVRNMVLANKTKEGINFVVVNPPGREKNQRDSLSDLALILGTEPITSLSGSDFSGRESMFLGTAKKVSITKSNTIVTPSLTVPTDRVEGKILDLKSEIAESTSELEKNYLKSRIAKLTGGISIIKVGGITPSEVEEKIARVDDAVRAVRSAKEEGVLAGGGVALYNACIELDLDDVTSKSIEAPYNKILSNANFKPKERMKWERSDKWFYFVKHIFKNGFKHEMIDNSSVYPYGYDVKEFKEVNMFDAGIVDATKVVRNALINAFSASSNLFMTRNVVTLKRIENE